MGSAFPLTVDGARIVLLLRSGRQQTDDWPNKKPGAEVRAGLLSQLF